MGERYPVFTWAGGRRVYLRAGLLPVYLYAGCRCSATTGSNLEDVAASLGIAPWQVFFRVVLPQLKLAIWGGALLVGLHLLAEYGLYVMIRFDTFTTAIYDQFQSTFSGPAANMLAGVLALCCPGFCCWKGATRGKARYARVGRLRPPSEYPCTRNGRSSAGTTPAGLRGRAGVGNAHRGAGALAVGGRHGGLAER